MAVNSNNCGILTRGPGDPAGALGGTQATVNYYDDLNTAAATPGGMGTVVFDLDPIYVAYNVLMSWDIARYGDKIWMFARYAPLGPNSDPSDQETGIIELNFD